MSGMSDYRRIEKLQELVDVLLAPWESTGSATIPSPRCAIPGNEYPANARAAVSELLQDSRKDALRRLAALKGIRAVPVLPGKWQLRQQVDGQTWIFSGPHDSPEEAWDSLRWEPTKGDEPDYLDLDQLPAKDRALLFDLQLQERLLEQLRVDKKTLAFRLDEVKEEREKALRERDDEKAAVAHYKSMSEADLKRLDQYKDQLAKLKKGLELKNNVIDARDVLIRNLHSEADDLRRDLSRKEKEIETWAQADRERTQTVVNAASRIVDLEKELAATTEERGTLAMPKAHAGKSWHLFEGLPRELKQRAPAHLVPLWAAVNQRVSYDPATRTFCYKDHATRRYMTVDAEKPAQRLEPVPQPFPPPSVTEDWGAPPPPPHSESTFRRRVSGRSEDNAFARLRAAAKTYVQRLGQTFDTDAAKARALEGERAILFNRWAEASRSSEDEARWRADFPLYVAVANLRSKWENASKSGIVGAFIATKNERDKIRTLLG